MIIPVSIQNLRARTRSFQQQEHTKLESLYLLNLRFPLELLHLEPLLLVKFLPLPNLLSTELNPLPEQFSVTVF